MIALSSRSYMPRRHRPLLPAALAGALAALVPPAAAQEAQAQGQQEASAPDCGGLPDHGSLTQALRDVVAPGDPEANGGLGNHMWAVVVNRAGVICAVTYSGENFGDQWPGSRAIAAEKAFTANAFSLPDFALSTANLYWPSQPENSLYALATSNPVHEEAFYFGDASSWGAEDDPVVGRRVGGTMVFGGGLALYDDGGELVGGLGVSGDESCTDHVGSKHRSLLFFCPTSARPGTGREKVAEFLGDRGRRRAAGRVAVAAGAFHPPRSRVDAQVMDDVVVIGFGDAGWDVVEFGGVPYLPGDDVGWARRLGSFERSRPRLRMHPTAAC